MDAGRDGAYSAHGGTRLPPNSGGQATARAPRPQASVRRLNMAIATIGIPFEGGGSTKTAAMPRGNRPRADPPRRAFIRPASTVRRIEGRPQDSWPGLAEVGAYRPRDLNLNHLSDRRPDPARLLSL